MKIKHRIKIQQLIPVPKNEYSSREDHCYDKSNNLSSSTPAGRPTFLPTFVHRNPYLRSNVRVNIIKIRLKVFSSYNGRHLQYEQKKLTLANYSKSVRWRVLIWVQGPKLDAEPTMQISACLRVYYRLKMSQVCGNAQLCYEKVKLLNSLLSLIYIFQ